MESSEKKKSTNKEKGSNKEKGPNKEKDKQKALIQPNNPANKSKSLPTSNLFSALNCNTNIFSQLSSMYTQQEQNTGEGQQQTKPSTKTDYSSILLTKFDPEIQRILHSLSKRSEVTKLKALLELQEILKSRDESFLDSFLPTYTYLYKQIITCEYEKKLLEEANQILMIYVSKAKNCLKGQFKELFPYWFLSMNDPNTEVSLISQKAFDILFTIEKRAQVIAVFSEAFLTNMSFFLKLDLKQIMDENNALVESQANEILDRLTVATCHGLGVSLQWIKGSPKENEYLEMFSKTLDLDKESVGLIKLLEILENKKRGLRSRSAILDLIADIYENMEPERDFPHQIIHITKAVFSLIDDKERILQIALWKKCLIVLLKKTSETTWKKISEGKQKDVLINRIIEVLKKAGHGIGATFYENLTIFLSLLPYAKLKGETNEESFKTKLSFIKNYMEAIWHGITHEEIKFFSESLVSAYFECLYFLNLKRFGDLQSSGLSESLMKFTYKILKGFIQMPLDDYLKFYNSSQSLNAYKSIPKRMAEFFENLSSCISKDENDFFRNLMRDYFFEIKEKQKLLKTLNFTENYCCFIGELLSIIKNNDHIELVTPVELTILDTYKETLDNLVSTFNGKIDDFSSDKIIVQMKIYYSVTNEIKKFIQFFSKDFLKNLEILKSFEILFKIMDKILLSLGDICKCSNIEKISSNYSKIIYLWFYISEKKNVFENENERITHFGAFPKLLIEKLANLEEISMNISQNLLIFITFFVDPQYPETLFTDYQALAPNQHQQDIIVWKALEKSLVSYTEKNELIHNSNEFQELIVMYIESFYNIKNYSYGLIQIPCVFNLFRFSLEEKQLKILINKTSVFCEELSNKQKLDSFEKLKNIYVVTSFLLSDKKISLEIRQEIIEKLYKLFFHFIIKVYHLKNCKDLLDHFYDLIEIIDQKSPHFQEITNIAFNEMSLLIIAAMKDNNEANIEITIEFLCDYLYFLKLHKKTKEILFFFHEILFKNSMFTECLSSKTIWNILKHCLDTIMDFKSLNEILSFNDIFLKEIWLISLFLTAPNTYALFKELNLKKFYQENMREEIISLFFIDTKENREEIIIKIVDKLIEDSESKSLAFVNGLKFFVKSMMKKESPTLKQHLQQRLQSYITSFNPEKEEIHENIFRKCLISKTMLNNIESCNIPKEYIEDLFNKLRKIISSEQKTKGELEFLVYLDILLTIHSSQKLAGFLDEELLEKTIKYFFENFTFNKLKDKDAIPMNFVFGVAFDFFNFLSEEKTFVVLSDYIKSVEELIRECFNFNKQPNKFYIRSLISANNFLRKLLGFLEAFSLEFRNFINQDLMMFFVNRLKGFKEENNEEVMFDESNDQMIVEFAETINRFGVILTKEISETMMLELIISPFPAIQKSAFIALKQFYQNIKQEIKITLKEDQIQLCEINKIISDNTLAYLKDCIDFMKDWVNEESFLNPKVYSYLLIWISFLLKINSTLFSINELELIKRLVKEYFENNVAYYFEFLNICFQGLKLFDPSLNGVQNSGNKGSFISQELMKLEIEWSEFLFKDSLIKLLTQALYQFSMNFPSFIRKWAESTDKKYLKTAEYYLKTYISPALFLSEIETIELRQQEWKSEEFNIYVAKNTREINAILTKEYSQLEISLKVPIDYPLKEISISCEKEVKLPEAKITKWIMRMKSLLRTENNTILNLLLIWKYNLEKEFEGLEECPICYYVIHSSTKEIPKLACKTCSHKFHSSCIHKWFNSSNKSECPLCKSQFL